MNSLWKTMRSVVLAYVVNMVLITVLTGGVCFIAVVAQAAEPVGWVQEAVGAVTIHSSGKSINAKAGSGVLQHDRITTAANSHAQIMFRDKTTLAMAASSELVVADVYLKETDKSAARLVIKTVSGVFGFLMGGIAKSNPNGFKVETPIVALGIRGTEFGSAVSEDEELHGLYAGGPVVVSLNTPTKPTLDAEDRENLCFELEDTVKGFERAHRLNWGAGRHTEAKQFKAKAEEYEKLLHQYNCE